jgi:asparagine synthase (glutamine-hydrolysing)
MCGINGIFAYHYAANPIDREELLRTRDYMAMRGPDGRGEWLSADGRIAFGHRRLSIIDLSVTGAQPMASTDGTQVITFNGEIYNYRALRMELEAKGRTFRSHSDTEVLLHLYATKGEAMVHELRGMFAFAIWDAARNHLFLARDPYGIKPLYYADDGWTFRFASQVRALLAGNAIPHDADPAGQVGFYLFGSVPDPFTTYRAIRALPAGATLLVDRVGAHEPRRYHTIAQVYKDAEATARACSIGDNQNTLAIREALLDSVRHHLVADVSVGAFLSAGIDSGALVGLMRDAGQQDIQTVTLAFGEYLGRPEDEAPLAEEVARSYETRHTTRVVTEAEFSADLPRILEAMDQPSIDGINTWFVSKAARELGLKVAISGLGGDELFGGYASFQDIPRWVRAVRMPAFIPVLGKATRKVVARHSRWLGLNPKAAGLLEFGGSWAGAWLLKRGLYMPWELRDLLNGDLVIEGLRRLKPLQHIMRELEPSSRTAFGRVATLESALYMRNQLLRDTDWASMAHSLEVRVPLVDAVLLRKMARLIPMMPTGAGKQMLAVAPSRALPDVITKRSKTGFTTPVKSWMQLVAASPGSGTPRNGPARATPWARDWSRIVGQKHLALS